MQLRCSPQLSSKRAAGASYYHSLPSQFNSALQAQHPAHDPTKSFPFPFSVRSGTGLTSVCLPKSFLQGQLAQLITQVVCTPYKNQSKSQKVRQYRSCSKIATTDPQAPFPLQYFIKDVNASITKQRISQVHFGWMCAKVEDIIWSQRLTCVQPVAA